MKFEVVKQEKVYQGYSRLYKYSIKHSLFQGGMSKAITREVLDRGQAVAIFMYDPKTDDVILVKQFRIGAINNEDPWLLEMVAGIVELGEQDEDVARREAEEESGVMIGELTRVGSFYNSAGCSTEKTTIFYADVDSTAALEYAGLDTENEDIQVVKMKSNEFLGLLKNDDINVISLGLAGYWFANKRKVNERIVSAKKNKHLLTDVQLAEFKTQGRK